MTGRTVGQCACGAATSPDDRSCLACGLPLLDEWTDVQDDTSGVEDGWTAPEPRPVRSLVATSLSAAPPSLTKASDGLGRTDVGLPVPAAGEAKHAHRAEPVVRRRLARHPRVVGGVSLVLAVALVMLVASVVVRVSGSSPADAEQTGTVTLSQQTEEVGVRQIQSFCSSLRSNPEADIAIDMRVSADDLCQAFEDSYPASAAEGRRDRYVDLLRSNGLWRQFTGESAAVRFGRGVCRSVGEQQVVATLASVAAVSALCPEHLAQLNLNNAATSTAAGQPTRSTVALWRMNEGRGTSVAFDSSAAGLDATVGSLVRTGQRRGSAVSYVFPEAKPNATPVSRERLMVVPDDVGLDPGRRHYSITIRYRTTHHYGNLLQKGQSGTPGGFWKLQQPGGLLQCFWSGSEGQATVNSGRVLNDGRWHVVTCERSGPTLTMTVDGLVSDTTQKRIGSVSNAMPLTVGGKWACNQVRVGCDYFSGSLDYVRIDARP